MALATRPSTFNRRILTKLRPCIVPMTTRSEVIDQLEQAVEESLDISTGWANDVGNDFPDERCEVVELDCDEVDIDLLCGAWFVERMGERKSFFVTVDGVKVHCMFSRRVRVSLRWSVEAME